MSANAFLLDLGKCIGCQACVAACKIGNELPADTQYIHIGEISSGRYPEVTTYVENRRCFHCTDAACVAVCPTGALFHEDGFTRVNAASCSACGYCVSACPFSVPQVIDGHVHKCDGCADVVQAGGVPWCVKTCPNEALKFGPREEILAEAQRRLIRLQRRCSDARLYGESEAGGLGVIALLPARPEEFELPADPQISGLTVGWQKVTQPASLGLTALSVVATGLAAIIARRTHMKEMRTIEEAAKKRPVTEAAVEVEENVKNLPLIDPAGEPKEEVRNDPTT